MRCQDDVPCAVQSGTVFGCLQEGLAYTLAFETGVNGNVDQMCLLSIDGQNSAAGNSIIRLGDEYDPLQDLPFQPAGDIGEIRQSCL